ncbi:MAG: hypothetical protein JNK53_03260, partial [Phycisphaerae bacterium]|nr:hypothetical protein [Phycisphaerae bacterium]
MSAYAIRADFPCLEPFQSIERRAPGIAAIHLIIGCAWCFSLSLGAAVEGAMFGLLLAVALVRLPATHSLYPRLLASPVGLAYLAMVAWQLASNMWSVIPVDDWGDALFSRRLFVLLALWPLAARWRSLLVALCAGALLGAAATAVAVVVHGRLGLQSSDLVIAKYRSSAGPLAAVGIVTAVAYMFWARSRAAWWLCLAAISLFALQIAALAGRAPALAAAVGVVAVLIRSSNPAGSILRRYTVLALAFGA